MQPQYFSHGGREPALFPIEPHSHSSIMTTTPGTTPLAPAEIAQQVPLTPHVVGHPRVMSSADGSTIIKHCLLAEKLFYEAMWEAPDGSAMAALRRLCPEFRGTTEDGSVSRLLSVYRKKKRKKKSWT